MPKAKVFNIMQYVKHKETGKELIDETAIKLGLAHRTIQEWAYILHDKDKMEDGSPKPPHYHIVLKLGTAVDVETIAKWFQIPSNFVDIPKGWGAFLDCVEYLTHEAKPEKHHYGDDEVCANFDFRGALNRKNQNRLQYGKDLNEKEQMMVDVLHGKSLRDCMAEDELLYISNIDKLHKLRLEYISMQEPPKLRLNYYVYGPGGIGKGLMCRALARALFPISDNDEDIFFETGSKNALFEGYDGQPVIIWNDCRALDLLNALNGRGNVFNVFDTHPSGQRQNVKYSSVRLCNCVNIVNGIQGYTEFLDGLAGEYKDRSGEEFKAEDKSQSYRRFPFIIPISENDFDLLLNKGFAEGTREYEQYFEYKKIQGNMQKVRQLCGANEVMAKELETKTLKPVVEKHAEIVKKQNDGQGTMTDDELRAYFADYGAVIPAPPETEEAGDNEDLPF